MENFWGKDLGIVVLASFLAEKEAQIKISPAKQTGICEKDFWLKNLAKIVEEKTKFGRIGIIFDRKNKEAESFCNNLAINNFNYQPKNSRALPQPEIKIIKSQVITEIANEGLTDSVEFRRLIRKYTKNAKDLHLDSLFFLEGIFAEKKTCQIVAKIAGTQIKCYFLTDFLEKKENPAKIKFKIETTDDIEFTKTRAEKILQRKLKNSDFLGS